MVRSIAIAVSLFAANAAAAGGMAPVWAGQMTQYDASGTKTYPVRLIRLGDSITSEYPTLKCRGTWTQIGARGDYKIYEERIGDGRLTKGAAQGCIDGIVTFRDGWKEAHLGWFASFEGEPTSAWAVLKPVQK
jgi:hypothetical protein